MEQLLQAEAMHRYPKPWRMFDRVVDIEEQRIATIKLISFSDYYIAGHFPSYSVYPGMLLLEGMKQSAVLLSTCAHCANDVESGLPGMTELSVRFLRPVVPGDTVRFEVNAAWAMDGTDRDRYEGRGTVEGISVCLASFTLPRRRCVCTSG
ncbi:3-hydroxyacyl-ACP dehydratase FabZ family protein [Paenibacillus sp. SYP-B4298]|uniref:3-hydroxyacyl-ACP dehydratase FabZ family protein n=1 Tax=Paenibacillus sp. SYP-B4298 TaxID=2996034 RepID=UPI0022DE3697|nr:3-hydroxyacyl-ACP dehydratase FabZ family protein [Paenibacillus sp. SYP-B4298]